MEDHAVRMDNKLRDQLRLAYAKQVDAREAREPEGWRIEERGIFLDELVKNGAMTLLEIGAGIGRDAEFFANQGLEVLATDLTEENVARCREKGLRAEEMDVCDLKLQPASFDAVYSLNCLLHVPRDEFQIALQNIHDVLRSGGLFYLSLFGGPDDEGIYQEDFAEPKRFFSRWSDESLRQEVRKLFEILRFQVITLESTSEIHLQSLILRKAY
jgi:SAM-dependent methyltransferase